MRIQKVWNGSAGVGVRKCDAGHLCHTRQRLPNQDNPKRLNAAPIEQSCNTVDLTSPIVKQSS